MQKLLDAYLLNPTLANAVKVRNYSRKHMMAVVLLTDAMQLTLQAAIRHADRGKAD